MTPDIDKEPILKHLFQIPVIVAALGYLVDMYDLFLFNVVRVPSLKSLGVSGNQLFKDGLTLLNLQLFGLLIGGIFWGILGDKKGRLSVLFGSIIIYSLANIANGFVIDFSQYALLRFVAGFGLAGELGAGITLVSEILPRKSRGYGTTLVATMGVLGAILAYFVADQFQWRMSYFVGGGLGLLLLILRINVFESGMYTALKGKQVRRGNIFMLFTSKARFFKYVKSILIGLPIWYVVGILIFFSPEIGAAIGLKEPVQAGKAVLFSFSGQVLGDIASGLFSQYFKSRKKVVLAFVLMSFLFMMVYLLLPNRELTVFYVACACLGFANGYWALFVTIAAELFGTNLRATVATTVPNFVRGAVIPLSLLFSQAKDRFGIIQAGVMVGIFTVMLALLALRSLDETFGKDLNYLEGD